jgi:hypothetical protein
MSQTKDELLRHLNMTPEIYALMAVSDTRSRTPIDATLLESIHPIDHHLLDGRDSSPC